MYRIDKKNYCQDCGKKLKCYWTKFCNSCASKRNWLNKNFKEKTSKKISKAWGKKIKIGTIRQDIYGYKWIKITKNKWLQEHRYIVEKFIGKKLKSKEVIHHIDYNRANNQLDNLYIFPTARVHSGYELLIRYKLIDKYYLKSNLKRIKDAF